MSKGDSQRKRSRRLLGVIAFAMVLIASVLVYSFLNIATVNVKLVNNSESTLSEVRVWTEHTGAGNEDVGRGPTSIRPGTSEEISFVPRRDGSLVVGYRIKQEGGETEYIHRPHNGYVASLGPNGTFTIDLPQESE